MHYFWRKRAELQVFNTNASTKLHHFLALFDSGTVLQRVINNNNEKSFSARYSQLSLLKKSLYLSQCNVVAHRSHCMAPKEEAQLQASDLVKDNDRKINLIYVLMVGETRATRVTHTSQRRTNSTRICRVSVPEGAQEPLAVRQQCLPLSRLAALLFADPCSVQGILRSWLLTEWWKKWLPDFFIKTTTV